MTTAVYIRVSTYDQNLDVQRGELSRWLERSGITDVVWFEDQESGKDLNRPDFQRLQRAVIRREVDTVVVWKLDRLSRSLKDGVNLISDWLERGVRIVSVTQAIDMAGAAGRMFAAILFAVAEMERELLRERQAAGIAAAKARGVYTGRPRGATKAKPEEARRLKDLGLKPEQIATALGISRSTVRRYTT